MTIRHFALVILSMAAVGRLPATELFTAAEEEAIWTISDRNLQFIKAGDYTAAARLMTSEDIDGFKQTILSAVAVALEKGKEDDLVEIFGTGKGSLDTIRAESAAEIVGQVMAYAIGRSTVAKEAMASMSYARIGIVKRTPAAGFALVEMTMSVRGSTVNAYEVIPVAKADNGAWTIGMKADFRKIANGIKASLEK